MGQVRKTSRRDLPVVAAQRCDGATTVSATMLLAARVGIAVFVTGGAQLLGHLLQMHLSVLRLEPSGQTVEAIELVRTAFAAMCKLVCGRL